MPNGDGSGHESDERCSCWVLLMVATCELVYIFTLTQSIYQSHFGPNKKSLVVYIYPLDLLPCQISSNTKCVYIRKSSVPKATVSD